MMLLVRTLKKALFCKVAIRIDRLGPLFAGIRNNSGLLTLHTYRLALVDNLLLFQHF
jgi:hypothetical protein